MKMNIKIKVKVKWKEYELTQDWNRKPTDDVELNIDIDPHEDSLSNDRLDSGYIDESRSKFSPISVYDSKKS